MEVAGIVVDRAALNYEDFTTVEEKISEQLAAALYLADKHRHLIRGLVPVFYVEAPSKLNNLSRQEIDRLLAEEAEELVHNRAKVIEMFKPITKKAK